MMPSLTRMISVAVLGMTAVVSADDLRTALVNNGMGHLADLIEIAGMGEVVTNSGKNYAVFAPSDIAIDHLPAELLEEMFPSLPEEFYGLIDGRRALESKPEHLDEVMQLHVVEAEIDTDGLEEESLEMGIQDIIGLMGTLSFAQILTLITTMIKPMEFCIPGIAMDLCWLVDRDGISFSGFAVLMGGNEGGSESQVSDIQPIEFDQGIIYPIGQLAVATSEPAPPQTPCSWLNSLLGLCY